MKKNMLLVLVLFLMFPAYSGAEEFLGAPVISQGETLNKTDVRLELKSDLSHDEVVAFYQDALKDFSDIKFRDWPDATYIEDDGNAQWHSITISKEDKNGTNIVIMKDNWTWIIGTLILRYIGVFVVLLILLIGMTISGAIISRSVKKREASS
ncbi:MAG: hypothetical protein JRI74_06845 [Deltaproteobacteria bacterium]|nr:hypothetical protein [Deltaproteobacteria bacterium]MBW2217516.1 hypothetical protein [Deltaproteobacteria bacterium]